MSSPPPPRVIISRRAIAIARGAERGSPSYYYVPTIYTRSPTDGLQSKTIRPCSAYDITCVCVPAYYNNTRYYILSNTQLQIALVCVWRTIAIFILDIPICNTGNNIINVCTSGQSLQRHWQCMCVCVCFWIAFIFKIIIIIWIWIWYILCCFEDRKMCRSYE